MKKSYKNVIFDYQNYQMLIRRVGSIKYEKVDYKPFFYISTDEQTNTKDIYGDYMVRIEGNKELSTRMKNSGVKVCESDLDPVTKYLHEEFDKEEINSSEKDFRICYFDIECQAGRRYHLDHIIKIKAKKGSSEFSEIGIRNFEDNYNTNDYLIFDEETKKWDNYKGSCYLNTEFPDPDLALCPINLLTCYSTIDGKLYTWGTEPYTDETNPITDYICLEDELEMLVNWLKWFNKQNFDIFTGYNSDLFDIPYIINRLKLLTERQGIKKDYSILLSPLGRPARAKKKTAIKTGKPDGNTYDIAGLINIDFLEAFKKFGGHANLPSWSLNYVAELELGDHKIDYDGPITEIYRKDWNEYVRYNRKDVTLLIRLNEKKRIFDMMISFAIDCLIPLNKVFSMIATVNGYILKFIHSEGIVMNDKPEHVKYDWWLDEGCYKIKEPDGNIYYQNCDWEKGKKTFEPYHVKAGYVYADPGRYSYLISGDIVSSYPFQIMSYNISPETKVIKPTKEMMESGDYIKSEINQVWYSRNPKAILPAVVKKVFDEKDHFTDLRKQAYKEGNKENWQLYNNLRENKKIIANSVYGVCLNKHFHFFDIDNARAITRGGRVCIRYIKTNTDRYYRDKQLLVDGTEFMPVINLKYNGEDHWFKKSDVLTVKVIDSGEVISIEAKDFDENKYLLGSES